MSSGDLLEQGWAVALILLFSIVLVVVLSIDAWLFTNVQERPVENAAVGFVAAGDMKCWNYALVFFVTVFTIYLLVHWIMMKRDALYEPPSRVWRRMVVAADDGARPAHHTHSHHRHHQHGASERV